MFVEFTPDVCEINRYSQQVPSLSQVLPYIFVDSCVTIAGVTIIVLQVLYGCDADLIVLLGV